MNPVSHVIEPIIKTGITYTWVVTIHPFEDGDWRIARAIGDGDG